MSIVTVASGKGGCGKTTIAELVLGACADEGHSVGAIDTDINQTLAKWCSDIASYPITAAAEADETKIIALAGELEESHDLVVIDTAGASAQATVFAIGCADLVVIPVQLSSADLIEAVRMRDLVKSAGNLSRRSIDHRLLLTDYQRHTNIATLVERVIDENALPTMRTKLHRLVAFKEMTFTGDVPRTGRAGECVRQLVNEMTALGAMPFRERQRARA